MGFPSIMDYMQNIFSFFNAPLFATFLLGMFWKRATPWGAFWGLVIGTLTAILHFYVLTGHEPFVYTFCDGRQLLALHFCMDCLLRIYNCNFFVNQAKTRRGACWAGLG